MRNLRLPRKIKKFFKTKKIEEWEKFVYEKEVFKIREEHIDKIFTKNYNNVYKIFHKVLK